MPRARRVKREGAGPQPITRAWHGRNRGYITQNHYFVVRETRCNVSILWFNLLLRDIPNNMLFPLQAHYQLGTILNSLQFITYVYSLNLLKFVITFNTNNLSYFYIMLSWKRVRLKLQLYWEVGNKKLIYNHYALLISCIYIFMTIFVSPKLIM